MNPKRSRLPLGTDMVAGGPKHWHAIAKASRERAEREGRLTHFYLLDEAAAACLAEEDPKELKSKLYMLLVETIDAIADVDPDTTTMNPVVTTYQNSIEAIIQWMRDRTGAVRNG